MEIEEICILGGNQGRKLQNEKSGKVQNQAWPAFYCP